MSETESQVLLASEEKSLSVASLEKELDALKIDEQLPERICHSCNEKIVDGVPFLRVDGRLYHNNHFVCKHCGERFGTNSYYERDGHPYCEKDYNELFVSKCSHCKQPIAGQIVEALGLEFHPACFKCSNCDKLLDNEPYFTLSGKAFCSDCHLPKCAGCGTTIEGEFSKALDASWHAACFACYKCKEPFTDGRYYTEGDKAYCAVHFYELKGVVCAFCNESMSDIFVEIEGKKYHPNHFTCAFCRKVLLTDGDDTARVRKKDNKYACDDCASTS